jgi:hypothetical protein
MKKHTLSVSKELGELVKEEIKESFPEIKIIEFIDRGNSCQISIEYLCHSSLFYLGLFSGGRRWMKHFQN